ncbi:hypothetical protein JL720_13930 [Aureococcus anophagefferens]|nr:hypothetical protein JL720_13930 [Aureococcus anophagefferens]
MKAEEAKVQVEAVAPAPDVPPAAEPAPSVTPSPPGVSGPRPASASRATGDGARVIPDAEAAAVAAATPPGDDDDELESSTPSRAARKRRGRVRRSAAGPRRVLATIMDAAAPNAAPEGDVPVDVTVEMEPLRARFLSRGELDEGRNAP